MKTDITNSAHCFMMFRVSVGFCSVSEGAKRMTIILGTHDFLLFLCIAAYSIKGCNFLIESRILGVVKYYSLFHTEF